MVTTPRKRHIGYIGLGAMGGGMAAHLLSNGYPLSVYDVDPEAVDRLVRKGASAAASPKDAAERSELLITCLPSANAVEEAVLGNDGVVAGMSPEQIYIDMSTVAPETTRKLGAAVAHRQGHMLDVPLGKGPDEAATGDLSLMVGGDPAVVERCADVLDMVGSKRFYCGELGTGVTVKIVNNLVSCAVSTLVVEAFAIGDAAGVHPELLREVMMNTGAGNWITSRLVVDEVQGRSVARNPYYTPHLFRKDLGLASDLAKSLGSPNRMGSTALELHAAAGQG